MRVPLFISTHMTLSSKSKKLAAAVIVGAGIIGTYLILSSERANGNVLFDVDFKKNSDAALGFQKGDVVPNNPNNTFDPNNLTDVFLSKYAAEILKKNPQGPLDLEGQRKITIPSQESLEKIIQEEMEQGVAIQEVTSREIKHTTDDSPAAALSYIQSIISANERMSKKTNNNLGEVAYLWLEKNNADPITKQMDALSVLVSDLLAVPVPPSWKDVHLSMINLQQKKITVLQSIFDINSDPVKALAAAHIIETLSLEEQDVARMIRTKAQKIL